VNGIEVHSIEDLDTARRLAQWEDAPAIAELHREPFGRRNLCPAGMRGWIFLERFCSMIKMAMVDCGLAAVAFSNSEAIMAQLHEGSARLKLAAKIGKERLKEVLEGFLEELQVKSFSAVSVDKELL